MKSTTYSEKEKPRLSSAVLWIMTITTGFVVANIYYNQPMLPDIAQTFKINNGKAGQVAVITQVGYAVGMLFIVPLGDMLERKMLMLIDFVFMIGALLFAAMASSFAALLIASLFIGITSILPQLLVPMAAQLALPQERGEKIGFIMSGLLIGILASRTLSGIVSEYLGWRSMFYIAAFIMLIIWLMVYIKLPHLAVSYQGKYRELMWSLLPLIKKEPALRLASIRGGLCFASFSAFWTTLGFLLKQHFGLSSAVTGEFGLLGILGAVAAGYTGRLSDKINPYKLSIYSILLVVISFGVCLVSGHSLIGIAIAVILMDIGVQATHISNQSVIFALNPSARNRINTIYIVSYFTGGAIGTYLATQAWNIYNWTGVCMVGLFLAGSALIIHLLHTPETAVMPGLQAPVEQSAF